MMKGIQMPYNGADAADNDGVATGGSIKDPAEFKTKDSENDVDAKPRAGAPSMGCRCTAYAAAAAAGWRSFRAYEGHGGGSELGGAAVAAVHDGAFGVVRRGAVDDR